MNQVKITGLSETIELDRTVCDGFSWKMISPEDSNARSTDLFYDMEIRALVNPSSSSAESLKIDRWAQIDDDHEDCHRRVVAEAVEGNQVIRRVTFPNAFILDYDIDFTDKEGSGVLILHVRQKKDLNDSVTIEGGFAS